MQAVPDGPLSAVYGSSAAAPPKHSGLSLAIPMENGGKG
jgi:hypothetical protein